MPNDIKWTSPGGGPVLWLELPKQIDLRKLQEHLKAARVLIQLSNDAFFRIPHSHGFKIGYAFLSQSEMEEGVEKLSREVKKLLNI